MSEFCLACGPSCAHGDKGRRRAKPVVSGDVGAEEPGCACGGMAACLQCQDRDTLGAEVAADMLDAAILGVVDVESASPDPSVEEYARAVLTALAPLIAERVEAAKAEALREAAAGVEMAQEAGATFDGVIEWLRDRAAALDPGPRP